MRRNLVLLIKPASGACNLMCKYCFYHDVAENREQRSYGIMKEETMEEIVKKAYDYADGAISFAFQGGEPTLRGLDFFKTFIAFVSKYNKNNVKTHFAIQTNGILVDEEWAKFLSENKFLVGLSMDGYREINDLNRVGTDGKGTFKKVKDATRIMDKYKVEYNILCVVTKPIAKHGVKVYNFFKSNGFRYIQFIPCLDDFGEEKGKRPYSLSPKDYGRFLISIFDMWYKDLISNNYISIRMFDNLINMLKGYPPESCDMMGVCSKGTIIEADGSLYPCDFYVIDKWRIGSVLDESFEELIANPKMDEFVETSKNIDEECKTCRHYMLCRSGCRRHKEHCGDGEDLKNIFCESYKLFYDYAENKLKHIARVV